MWGYCKEQEAAKLKAHGMITEVIPGLIPACAARKSWRGVSPECCFCPSPAVPLWGQMQDIPRVTWTQPGSAGGAEGDLVPVPRQGPQQGGECEILGEK